MRIITDEYETHNRKIIIEPDAPDNYVTDGQAYSKRVFLGANDTPDNWREVPESEVPHEEEEAPV